MNTLLIFFAFPVAVIIVSAILEKLLNNPFIVASLIFAVFLVVTFAAFDETFLIATLAYSILSFITAGVVNFIKQRNCEANSNSTLNTEQIQNSENTCDTIDDLLGTNASNNTNNCGCGCSRYRTRRKIT